MQYLYFKPRMSGSKCESCGLTHLALLRSAKCQERMERGERKKQERRNQRSATQEVAGGCSLPEEALVSFWAGKAQDFFYFPDPVLFVSLRYNVFFPF